MEFPKLARCLAAGLLFAMPFAHAEDIDLFTGVDAASADLPNVLIVIDNTANWSTAFTAEMAALASTVDDLENNKFRLGFMMYTETGSGNDNPDGAYVRAAVRTMSEAIKRYIKILSSTFM
jgi:type IV pilus assembly protein PilY1